MVDAVVCTVYLCVTVTDLIYVDTRYGRNYPRSLGWAVPDFPCHDLRCTTAFKVQIQEPEVSPTVKTYTAISGLFPVAGDRVTNPVRRVRCIQRAKRPRTRSLGVGGPGGHNKT